VIERSVKQRTPEQATHVLSPDSTQEEALCALGATLKELDYQFVTVTPATHSRVLARATGHGRTLRDAFGWNRLMDPSALPDAVLRLARQAGVVTALEGGVRMNVRFATLGGAIFAHSAFPTLQSDAVFFGPDTYRFVQFVRRSLPRISGHTLVDVGCGSGAAGIVLAPEVDSAILTDINARALRFARVNAKLAGASPTLVESDVLANVSQPFNVVIANPPYMLDPERRLYRDGGGAHGEALALRIAREALERLPSGGRLLLYTGAPIVEGRDALFAGLLPISRDANAFLEYEELDPDVFGEQLDEPGYGDVERIAAVGAVVVRL
jgi:methylase of polypeptide subunit release factors